MSTFKAFEVTEVADRQFESAVIEKSIADLPAGDVLIEVHYSSLNYKDALSASGNKGVTRNYPHTPGIDAAGVIAESGDPSLAVGQEVIVIGYDLGMNTAGGFGQYVRVPAQWVVPLPDCLSLRESMILGTAGFTAALCLEKLFLNGLDDKTGEVLVTGATGGVGIVAVALLSQLGYRVVASTGKKASHDRLRALGASEILDRSELSESNSKPMVAERWAGAVDVVGGDTLFNVIKSLRYGASVAACGLVQSPMFSASVFPFILRGVNLLGVDSVQLPLAHKKSVWNKLAGEWKLANLDTLATEIGLDDLQDCLQKVLAGQAEGRWILNLKR